MEQYNLKNGRDIKMGMLFEIIFDLFIDSSSDTVSDKKAPIGKRVAAALILVLLYGGVIAFCIYMAIHENSMIAVACGVLVLVITIPEAIKAYRKKKQQDE